MSRIIIILLIIAGVWVIFAYVLNGKISVTADLPKIGLK